MREPHWLGVPLLCEIHRQQIARHGGAGGIRDPGRLEAAADRPRNLYAYEKPSLFRLAACYAHGIASGHPFVDGNKRVSLLTCMIFLDRSGIEIVAADDAVYEIWISLASGSTNETGLTLWLENHARLFNRPGL